MPDALIATLDGLSGAASVVTPQSRVVIGQRAGMPSPSVFVKVGAVRPQAIDPVPSPSYGPAVPPPRETQADARARLYQRRQALADLRVQADVALNDLDHDPMSRSAGLRAVALVERAEVAAWLTRLAEQRVSIWETLNGATPPVALARRQQLARLIMADQAVMSVYRRRAAMPVSPYPTSALEARARLDSARREYARAIRL